jgi:hypothetical protein
MKASDRKKETMRRYNRKRNEELPEEEAVRKKRWYENLSDERREEIKKAARESYRKRKAEILAASIKEIKKAITNEN